MELRVASPTTFDSIVDGPGLRIGNIGLKVASIIVLDVITHKHTL